MTLDLHGLATVPACFWRPRFGLSKGSGSSPLASRISVPRRTPSRMARRCSSWNLCSR